MTERMNNHLLSYIEEFPDATLRDCQMSLQRRFKKEVSYTTIHRYLNWNMYSLKDLRRERLGMNTAENIEKQRQYCQVLKDHQAAGNFLIYMDETNFNTYQHCTRGRSFRGDRAVITLPSSKSANLQIQLAVNLHVGVIHSQAVNTSIHASVTADFIKDVYRMALDTEAYMSMYKSKKVVIILDNAPAHCHTHENLMELLQGPELAMLEVVSLGPYSPMLNPCKGCFSVLKSKINSKMQENRGRMNDFTTRGQMQAFRMDLLQTCWQECLEENVINAALVQKEKAHCHEFVGLALQSMPMPLGK